MSAHMHVHMNVKELTNSCALPLDLCCTVLACVSPSLWRGGVVIITESTLSSQHFGGFEVCKSAHKATSLQKLNPATLSLITPSIKVLTVWEGSKAEESTVFLRDLWDCDTWLTRWGRGRNSKSEWVTMAYAVRGKALFRGDV